MGFSALIFVLQETVLASLSLVQYGFLQNKDLCNKIPYFTKHCM